MYAPEIAKIADGPARMALACTALRHALERATHGKEVSLENMMPAPEPAPKPAL
jgi:hypothetical protein